MMFWLSQTRIRWLKILPPPLLVVCIGIIYSYVMEPRPKFLIYIPENVMKDSFTLPAFTAYGKTRACGPAFYWSLSL